MDVNDNAFILDERGALETIASKLAPTVLLVVHRSCVHPLTLWERACSRCRRLGPSGLPRRVQVHRPSRQRSRGLLIDRQRKPERRPAPRHIDQLNLAPVQLQNAMHDPQPQPAITPCAADIERAQEQAFAQFRGCLLYTSDAADE